jgi:peptide/nickel transport system substrate-binding protein
MVSQQQVGEAWLTGVAIVESNSPSVAGGQISVRVMSEPAGLTALDNISRDAWVTRMTRGLVYESLVELDAVSMNLKPGLAIAWSYDQKENATTFELVPNRKFATGAPLTARDVVAVCNAILDVSKPTSSVRDELPALKECSSSDDTHVTFRWKSSPFSSMRVLAKIPIVEASALDDFKALQTTPKGSGPYVVSNWKRGESLTLTRWDKTRARLDTIVFRFVKDATLANSLFERGEFDLMTNLQPSHWKAMEQPGQADFAKKDFNRLKSVDNSYSWIAWNEKNPLFSDARVRTAIAHAYDTALVSSLVDLNLELPTTCPFYFGSDSCDSTVKPIEFSIEKGRALLTEAGFTDTNGDGIVDKDGKPFEFSLTFPAAALRMGKIAPMYQESLKKMGVQMNIEKVDASTLTARQRSGNFDATSRVWTEFDREGSVFYTFHSKGTENFIGYSDSETDSLLNSLESESDLAARRVLERKVHARIYATQPYLFMTARQSLDAAKKTVHGLVPSLAWYDLRKVWVEKPPSP